MSNQFFELEIVRSTTKENIFVEWVEIQSPTGSFMVGPGHLPLISVLSDRSKVVYKKVESLEPEAIDVYGGLFKVQSNLAMVILDL